MNMKISKATESDLEAINSIRNAISIDDTSDHQLSSIDKFEIENNTSRATFIAKLDSRVVGYLTVHSFKNFEDDDAIFEVFILPQYQKRGVGTALIQHTEEHVMQHMKIKRLLLGVLGNNERAISLYSRLDYLEIKRDAKGLYMAKKINS